MHTIRSRDQAYLPTPSHQAYAHYYLEKATTPLHLSHTSAYYRWPRIAHHAMAQEFPATPLPDFPYCHLPINEKISSLGEFSLLSTYDRYRPREFGGGLEEKIGGCGYGDDCW